MRFHKIFLAISSVFLGMTGCIMTKNPKYQTESSYLDARYEQLVYLNSKKRLSNADYDEAYLLGTMYRDQNKLNEAKNLLKISFDNQHTLPAGVTYISVLKELGQKKEAENVHHILTMLYAENEIRTQEKHLQPD